MFSAFRGGCTCCKWGYGSDFVVEKNLLQIMGLLNDLSVLPLKTTTPLKAWTQLFFPNHPEQTPC